MQMPGVKYDFMVMVKMESEIIPIFVVKRPGVTEFLERLGETYNVAVFTAGLEDYASQPENGVPVKAFVDDLKDQELLKLVEFLEICYVYGDMRDAVQDLLPDRLM
ncbi:Haloacid dehalogenase-like hydrolase (HAD) superfamily protein [Raphanus sativus]|nr:Haloacid dehalogenase-like hydrolase (HAD) superfamily protein [Raphanus sativus]